MNTTKVISVFDGLSSDIKPTEDVAVGSLFYELDTRIKYVYWGGYGWHRDLDIDPMFGSLSVIDQEHRLIHDGRLFTVSSRFVLNNGGGSIDFLASVPTGVYPHFRSITVTSDGGPVDVDFYEAPGISDVGTPVTAFNNNRNSSRVASTLVYSTPVVTSVGTRLEPLLIPGTKHEGSLGSEASNEWILKTNSYSMIRVVNNTPGGGTSRFTINMFFYE